MAALKSAQVATLVKDAEEKRAKVRARRRVSGWTVTSSPARGPLTKLGISRLASDPPPAGLTVPPPSVRARTAVPQERTRNAQVLLLKYLRDNGYVDTAGTLTRESSAPLNDYEAASDVSLERVFEDVENHHVSARGEYPALVTRWSGREDDAPPTPSVSGRRAPHEHARAERAAAAPPPPPKHQQRGRRPRVGVAAKGGDDANADGAAVDGLGLAGLSITSSSTKTFASARATSSRGDGAAELPPPPDFGVAELNDLASAVTRDIFTGNPNVPFGSIAGLDDAKRLLREAVVMPTRHPELFVGLLSPWRGVLLYGPPGTGKTMLAKAVATECGTTFFNVSASTVVSKWRGDSEKLVRVLFDLARHYGPSTIFLDEIDALMSARGGGGGGGGEHEASRRMKTELLIQMDGLARSSPTTQTADSPRVFVLCASNLPWDLDLALLRRLEKRVLVGLPTEAARRRMISTLLKPHAMDADVSVEEIAASAEGYSGADVMLLCKEMAMRPLRRAMAATAEDDDDGAGAGAGGARARARARARAPTTPTTPRVGAITREDATRAREVSKPSAALHLQRYADWSEKYGSA
jgi:katanin p60 ATPase-containing subunit A1